MLVLLTGTARAGLISADFAPSGRVIRVALLWWNERYGCWLVVAELVLTGEWVYMVRCHFRQLWLWLVTDEFHTHQLCRHRFTQVGKQRLEQFESFCLIFLQRVTLA